MPVPVLGLSLPSGPTGFGDEGAVLGEAGDGNPLCPAGNERARLGNPLYGVAGVSSDALTRGTGTAGRSPPTRIGS